MLQNGYTAYTAYTVPLYHTVRMLKKSYTAYTAYTVPGRGRADAGCSVGKCRMQCRQVQDAV